jgi:hypothetical protein
MKITHREKVIAASLAVGIGLVFAACGGSDRGSGSGGDGGDDGSGSGQGGATMAGPSGTGGEISISVGIGGNAMGSGGGESCAGETSTAELVPLDLYIMLDKSGSMLDKTGANAQGPSKWDAVTQGLNAFFSDPQSAGIGVGLQYFPTRVPGVPENCTSNADCPGASGPCLTKACNNQATLTPCSTNANCPGGSCVNVGQCSNDPNYFCFTQGASCGGNLGTCVALYATWCVNRDSCDAVDYANPAVEFQALNGAAADLSASIAMISPQGATPTAPALEGAIQHASAWAAANPTHKVVTVLATDGLPTTCPPTDIPSIAQIAADGVAASPSILTFVIGVFAGNDVNAQQNLDAIAAAGGTQSAFFIDANQNVTQAFIDALNAIRGTKLKCEYLIPAPPPGETLDYGKVNVEHTPPGAASPTTIFYIADPAACDPMTGGWYYDADPAKGGTPTTIIMCPETCDAFSAAGGKVDIRLGCETEIGPPA